MTGTDEAAGATGIGETAASEGRDEAARPIGFIVEPADALCARFTTEAAEVTGKNEAAGAAGTCKSAAGATSLGEAATAEGTLASGIAIADTRRAVGLVKRGLLPNMWFIS